MSLNTDSAGRRKFPRRRFRREVGCLYRGLYQVIRAAEIGEGGMSFVTDQKMAEGESAVVSFQMPKGTFFSLMVVVRNQREKDGMFVYGCSFSKITFECKREIRSFVTARTTVEH